jgi:glutathione S-transferase
MSVVAFTRVAHEGGFDLGRHAAIRRWIADGEQALKLAPARQAGTS